MTKKSFLFDWTLPQIALLVEARLERDERSQAESKMNRDEKGKPMTMEDYVREMNA
jgi:hypothetical protein